MLRGIPDLGTTRREQVCQTGCWGCARGLRLLTTECAVAGRRADWKMAAVLLALVLSCLSVLCIADGAGPKATQDKKVVCYYTSWSQGRKSPYNFTPDKMDPHVCTHIIYAFATFGKNYELKASDPDAEIKNHGYAKVTKLKEKNQDLKVMLGTGGWVQGSLGFAEITASETTRDKFAKSAVKFLREHNFDGLDLNWQHPTFREGGKPEDKENYVLLAKVLQEEFKKEAAEKKKPKLLLSIGISHHQKSLPGYDIEGFNEYTDFISVICYDYSFSYASTANHHAPLYALPSSTEGDVKLNVNYTIDYFLKSADPGKLVLGIPTYGRSYKLVDPEDRDIGAQADGPGVAGPYTGEKGFLAYYEICTNIQKNNWTVVDSHPGLVGPYAYKGEQWVGYDDVAMVRHKTKFAKEKGLAGVMFWTVDYDDFLGTCHSNKKFPLVNAAKEELSRTP